MSIDEETEYFVKRPDGVVEEFDNLREAGASCDRILSEYEPEQIAGCWVKVYVVGYGKHGDGWNEERISYPVVKELIDVFSLEDFLSEYCGVD